MSIVAFIACVKTKAPNPMPARDLYISPWFIAARSYIERRTDWWFILSAEHGLLHPDMLVAPYEKTLVGANIEERAYWAAKVRTQLSMFEKPAKEHTALVLAGVNYRLGLMPYLHKVFAKVEVPMRQMPLGRQLQFLKDSARNPI